MKRFVVVLFTAIVSTYCWGLDSLQLNNIYYSVDTLQHFMAGPGSYYTSLELKASSRLHVYFLKVDASRPDVRIESALGRDSILLGERPSSMAQRKTTDGSIYFGGTNGDFYITSGDIGLPTGGTLVEGQLAYTPNNNRKVVAVDTSNRTFLGLMTFYGMVNYDGGTININHVNYNRGTNEVVLYNQHQGRSTKTNSYGSELEIELVSGESWRTDCPIHAVVTARHENQGNTTIQKGHAVLSGHGTGATALLNIQAGDTIELSLSTSVDNSYSRFNAILGGDPRALMLKNGVIEQNEIWDELHPRTAMGMSQTGDTIIFCVVDGRGTSVGCTTKVLAQLMQSAGAYSAINLDGGGSSCLYLQEYGPMNKVSDGTERAVCNAIFAVSNSPIDTTIAKIMSKKGHYTLPLYGVVKPTFLGYSQYDILIDTDVQGVTLSCDSMYGYINANGEFVASKGIDGYFTATYNGSITTQIPFKISDEASIKIRLDSVLIDNDTEYPIEVICTINNETADVEASAMDWTVMDPTICSVNDAKIKGLKNGRTMVIGVYGDIIDTIIVNVELPTAPIMYWEEYNANTIGLWQMTASLDTWNAQFTPSTATTPSNISFTYLSTRVPNIKLETSRIIYSTPDSIQLCFKPINLALSEVMIAIRPNNATKSTPISFTSIPNNEDVILTINPEVYYSQPNDQGIFPLDIDYITFFLDASNNTNNSSCQLQLNNIRLFFNNLTIEDGIENIQYGVSIYPNPCHNGMVNIECSGEKPLQCDLISLDGRIIKHINQVKTEENKLLLDVSGIVPGTYLIRLTMKDKNITSKLIIKQ